jgi:hypothetical protein
VGLEETHTDWLANDAALAALYPYRQVLPPWDAGGVSGMILLSTYPIGEQGVLDTPSTLWPRPDVMWARLDLGGGERLRVITAHPRPAAWGRVRPGGRATGRARGCRCCGSTTCSAAQTSCR